MDRVKPQFHWAFHQVRTAETDRRWKEPTPNCCREDTLPYRETVAAEEDLRRCKTSYRCKVTATTDSPLLILPPPSLLRNSTCCCRCCGSLRRCYTSENFDTPRSAYFRLLLLLPLLSPMPRKPCAADTPPKTPKLTWSAHSSFSRELYPPDRRHRLRYHTTDHWTRV